MPGLFPVFEGSGESNPVTHITHKNYLSALYRAVPEPLYLLPFIEQSPGGLVHYRHDVPPFGILVKSGTSDAEHLSRFLDRIPPVFIYYEFTR